MKNGDDLIIYKCEICGKEFNTIRKLKLHITTKHNITQNDYYDTYLKQKNDGICIKCGNPTKFISLEDGYKKYCHACAIENMKKTVQNTWLNKTIDDYKLINDKRKKTCLNKYNTENVMQSDIVYTRRQQTCLKKYGVEHPAQSNIVLKKMKNTCLSKYGVENPFQSDEIKEQIKETNKKKYGAEHAAQSNIIKEKIKETNKKKYGVEYYFQSEQYLLDLPNIKEKIKEINLDKYGVENPMQSYIVQNKIYETKKKNGTFNTSTIEYSFEEYLKNNNYQYIRQYKSDKYPFDCDFYVSDYDLYIEINAHWTHGRHSFESNNTEDVHILNEWTNKNTKYYNNAIEVWTVRDVNKQQIAVKNNLNYLVIYSNDINDVIKQFKSYIYNK